MVTFQNLIHNSPKHKVEASTANISPVQDATPFTAVDEVNVSSRSDPDRRHMMSENILISCSLSDRHFERLNDFNPLLAPKNCNGIKNI